MIVLKKNDVQFFTDWELLRCSYIINSIFCGKKVSQNPNTDGNLPLSQCNLSQHSLTCFRIKVSAPSFHWADVLLPVDNIDLPVNDIDHHLLLCLCSQPVNVYGLQMSVCNRDSLRCNKFSLNPIWIQIFMLGTTSV